VGIVLFVVVVWVQKILEMPDSNTYQGAVAERITPVLEKISKNNQKRFANYNTQRYGGKVRSYVSGGETLVLEYATPYPLEGRALEEEERDAAKAFKQHLCRNTPFAKLADEASAIKRAYGQEVAVSVDITLYEAETKRKLWSAAVRPTDCKE